MIRFVGGKPVQVPDDERITPELKALRTGTQAFLNLASGNSPEVQRLRQQFREGILSREAGFEWYVEPTT